MKEDLFIYRIIEKSGYDRYFRQRHEVRFERNIQLVLHEFAQLKEQIEYFETRESVLSGTRVCIFRDRVGNIICQKTLKENDFK